MKKVIIELRNFSKSYGKKTIIDNLNLEIYEGEFLTLLGSSGCGKTTILRSISGLDYPTSGNILLDGADITHVIPQDRQVNTIFQNYALFPLMTIEDNIGFGLKMKKISKAEINKRVKEMLDLVHLNGYEKRYPKDLSGGEQQRVSVVRGLINNPKVLLLDEPLSALDLKLRKKMQIELKQLQKKLGITFVYVTHDQDEALSMSDRIVVIHNGNIEQIGTPKEVYEHPKTLYVADFLGEANIFEARISSVQENRCEVKTKEDISFFVNNNNYSIGEKLNIVIRPEQIKILDNNTNGLESIVTEQIYDGSFIKVLVKTNNKIIKIMVCGSNKKYNKGDVIYISLDASDLIIIKEDLNEA